MYILMHIFSILIPSHLNLVFHSVGHHQIEVALFAHSVMLHLLGVPPKLVNPLVLLFYELMICPYLLQLHLPKTLKPLSFLLLFLLLQLNAINFVDNLLISESLKGILNVLCPFRKRINEFLFMTK